LTLTVALTTLQHYRAACDAIVKCKVFVKLTIKIILIVNTTALIKRSVCIAFLNSVRALILMVKNLFCTHSYCILLDVSILYVRELDMPTYFMCAYCST